LLSVPPPVCLAERMLRPVLRQRGAVRHVARGLAASASPLSGGNGSSGKPKIYIIHDEDRYVQPLLSEMTKRGTPFVEWNLNASKPSHIFDMSSTPPPGVYYNRISACGCDEHRDVPQLARGTLMWLQTHRRHIVNGPESISLTASKMEMQIALRLSNIATPHSIACFDDAQIVAAAERFEGEGKRFMIEPNRRDLGKGVVPFYTVGELKEHLASEDFVKSADNITMVQEYVRSKAPYINRVEFVGGRFLYGMHVDVSRGWDRLIPGYATDLKHAKKVSEKQEKVEPFTPVPIYQVLPDFEHPILDRYQEFMKTHGIDIASFEFAEDNFGNTVTFDVDICSTYNAAAEYRASVPKAGIGAITDYLSRLVELERPIRGTQDARQQRQQSRTIPAPAEVGLQPRDCLVVDGGMGRELRARAPDLVTSTTWSANVLIENPDLVKQVHIDFAKSGAQVITANNYACTPQFLGKGGIADQLDMLMNKAMQLVCEARDECGVEGVQTIASLPPLDESYRSDLVSTVESMTPTYEHLVSIIEKYPIDIILCETMSSKEEAYAAAKAAGKSGKKVWVSWTLRDDLSGLLRSGDTVQEAFDILQDLEVPVSGYLFNCCVPESIEQALPILMKLTDKPVGAMPNCFVPIPTDWTLNGPQGFRETREDMRPMDYAGYTRGWIEKGAKIVGGCCGIGPGHIQVMADDLGDRLSSVDNCY